VLAVERRLNKQTLPAPIRPFARQKPLAEQRPHPAPEETVLDEPVMLPDEHRLDMRGMVHQKGGTIREPKAHHIAVVAGRAREETQHVLRKLAQVAEEEGAFGSGRGGHLCHITSSRECGQLVFALRITRF
jgi:hypothetical protein